MWSQVAINLQNGNPYLIIIFLVAFAGFIIIIERFIMLQMVYSFDHKKFLANLRRTIQAEDLERAMSICRNASKTSLPAIGIKALEAGSLDPSSVRGVIEEETIDFLPKLESRIGILPAFATILLLIGVLGTIDGLWLAFRSVEVLDTTAKQAHLASGIANSLNPTSIGLIFSMIFLVSHQLLKGLALRLTEHIHYGVTVLMNLLAPAEVSAYVAGAPIDNSISSAPVAHASNDSDISAVEDVENDFVDVGEDIEDEEEII